VQGGDVRNDSEASAVQNGSHQERPASGDAKGGKQPRGKSKQRVPEQDLRRQLDMCSKHADVKRALELYDKFTAEGKRFFDQYNCNVVLYLCSSAATNSLKPSKSGNERRGEYSLVTTAVLLVYVIVKMLLRQRRGFLVTFEDSVDPAHQTEEMAYQVLSRVTSLVGR
jgi:hypothetical protein